MTGFDTAAELGPRLGDVAGVREFLRRFAHAWGDGALVDLGVPERDGDVVVVHHADPMIAETRWGIPLDAADLPDPPVVIDTGSGWRPYLDRLSLALVDLALTAVIQEHDERLCNACELPSETAMAAFSRVPLPDLPMWIDVEESPVRWWSRPGLLLRTHGDGGVWLWASAQTNADLETLYAAFPAVQWSV
ncbi:hypothetical protein ACTI_52480 [Actinoplanes sp. OR16]|uniref:hypothetical protein n=1 Tax=Actinoplanes sp. OR16 TaxID=946334 RepID=UPI000F6B8DE4|nr:hypothetical protein [Actinoplanes sp. OR16]BBH68563.1 hypothetical protein ACTI_52480 [Actinoplanes sp. OR16]